MRKKSHFGKLISIGNKSLQTADRQRVEAEEEAEEGEEEHKFRRIKIPKFSGEGTEGHDRQKSLPRNPLPVSICEPPHVRSQ